MNKTRLLTIAVIGLLVLNFAMLGMMFFNRPGHPPHPREGPEGEGPKKMIIERLHFDEAQQKAYQLLIDEHKDKMFQLNEASRMMHDELFSLLKNEPVDKAKADSLIQQIAENQKATDHLNFDHFEKIKMLCKGEQINDFNELVNDLGGLFSRRGPGKERR